MLEPLAKMRLRSPR